MTRPTTKRFDLVRTIETTAISKLLEYVVLKCIVVLLSLLRLGIINSPFQPTTIDAHLHNCNLLDGPSRSVVLGSDTFFWLDKWIGETPLKSTFPELYRIEKRKRCKVADKLSDNRFSGVWLAAPSTADQIRELSSLHMLLAAFQPVGPSDRWSCTLAPDGVFYVNLMRKQKLNRSSPIYLLLSLISGIYGSK
ncbi:hypothetical protein L1887_03224 [Cichorium endivia]|nr:hypothetical protein L1887_03224 [Cichorium endivia]